jgi:hypothetical protein
LAVRLFTKSVAEFFNQPSEVSMSLFVWRKAMIGGLIGGMSADIVNAFIPGSPWWFLMAPLFAFVACIIPFKSWPKEDPLAEAKIFLAYGSNQNAIRVLQEALEREPNRKDIQSMLEKIRSTPQTKISAPIVVGIIAVVIVLAYFLFNH